MCVCCVQQGWVSLGGGGHYDRDTHVAQSDDHISCVYVDSKTHVCMCICPLQVSPCTPFEVYDPHLDAWFSAAPPVTGPVSLSNHALVANQQEGLLITLGGCLTRCAAAGSGMHMCCTSLQSPLAPHYPQCFP